ncbi:methyl-accepting chemotaxis protein [Clostridium estertheticum]|uniref:Chemotaxis protein n=1 Tax=Clostridium estertheticum subsp. estertheticum TaxID=1552 RepID=A0A1J0GJ68_9CLOT|nr:methyl-accepting chemotaxis protein [Clostridium estertheticum]APC41377.1 chemotaxis protein [Clostridium estertheticum subsp. estertheticum]MBZ9616736.1 methyl-accepting chemotaxis protein [Clostridium estertheticum subsp. laramiense]WAG72446.1 methyl-accepting chemotaxis protein [Clostridium estertheticum]
MFSSIRKRLIFNFVLIAAIIILTCTSFLTHQMINGIQNQMKADGITLANNIRASIEKTGIKNIDKIQDILDGIYDYSDGQLCYIDVVSKDKTLVAGTSKNSIGQKINSNELGSVFEEKTSGNIYEWKGISAYNVGMPIKDGNSVEYSLSVGISIDSMQKAIKDTIIKSIIHAITVLILAAIAGICIGKRIARPIESLKETIEKIGEGDLTAEYKVTGKDEIGKLAAVSKETTKSIRELVRKIKVISESLSDLSKNINEGGNTVALSSEEIASSVTSVSEEGIKQTESLEDAVRLLENFSVDLDNVENELTILADIGNTIKEDTNIGADTVNKLTNTIDEMLNSFLIGKSKVDNLDKTIFQINSIVDVINGVASQTNLLALNASIEAARAGEAGKGFSVVAEEIRKLAEEVLNSSKSITQLINTVIEETEVVSSATKHATKMVEESRNEVNNVANSSKRTIEKVNEISKEINKVRLVLKGTMESRNKILNTVENIASKSQEISALSEEVTASTEEQTAITNELAITSQKIVTISSELKNDISSFNV